MLAELKLRPTAKTKAQLAVNNSNEPPEPIDLTECWQKGTRLWQQLEPGWRTAMISNNTPL